MTGRSYWLSEVTESTVASILSLLIIKLGIIIFPLPEVPPLLLRRGVGEDWRVRILDEYLVGKESIINSVLIPPSNPGILRLLSLGAEG